MSQFHTELRPYEKRKESGVITEVTRHKREGRACAELGCLRVEFKTRRGETRCFWTKLRKGLKLRVGQKISTWTTHLRGASAWRFDLNVVGIDINGQSVYRWTPKEKLFSYDGSGCC